MHARMDHTLHVASCGPTVMGLLFLALCTMHTLGLRHSMPCMSRTAWQLHALHPSWTVRYAGGQAEQTNVLCMASWHSPTSAVTTDLSGGPVQGSASHEFTYSLQLAACRSTDSSINALRIAKRKASYISHGIMWGWRQLAGVRAIFIIALCLCFTNHVFADDVTNVLLSTQLLDGAGDAFKVSLGTNASSEAGPDFRAASGVDAVNWLMRASFRNSSSALLEDPTLSDPGEIVHKHTNAWQACMCTCVHDVACCDMGVLSEQFQPCERAKSCAQNAAAAAALCCARNMLSSACVLGHPVVLLVALNVACCTSYVRHSD